MKVYSTRLMGLIEPKRFGDHLGFFAETYGRRTYSSLGGDVEFVQDKHSLSAALGTVRGLHFQSPPHAQAKLVRCGRGGRDSPTYGKWAGFTLSGENGAQLYIPAGFAHGFLTLEANSEIVYKCSDYYAPEAEGALRWDDPAIGIEWPIIEDAILSEKDANAPLLADLYSPFEFEG
jgi:dTDP-4-dehydrorhamnose 3,5-epimerase